MSLTMWIGGQKIKKEDQKNYEVLINGVTGQIIGLRKKGVIMNGTGRRDTPVLHRCV